MLPRQQTNHVFLKEAGRSELFSRNLPETVNQTATCALLDSKKMLTQPSMDSPHSLPAHADESQDHREMSSQNKDNSGTRNHETLEGPKEDQKEATMDTPGSYQLQVFSRPIAVSHRQSSSYHVGGSLVPRT